MKKFRWQIIIIFLTGIVVGILLLLEQPAPVETATPEEIQPLQGGVYVEALIGDLQRLNPILDTYNAVDRDVNRLVFSSLITFDDRGFPSGDLAESWGVSQDGKIYNFTLRENIFWHDGQPFTASDILFTIELIRNGGMTIPADLQTFWQQVDVRVLQDRHIQFTLPEPFAPFLDYLSQQILPQHLLGGLTYEEIVNAPFNVHPIGTGPYRVAKVETEQDWITGIELEVNELYYKRPAYIERIVFLYFPDAASAWQAYQDGIVQGISEVTPDILHEVLATEQLSLFSSRMPEFTTIFLNLNQPTAPFFADVAVRKALLQGINRNWISSKIMEGQAVITDSPILPGSWAHFRVAPTVEYNMEAAIEAFDSAEYVLEERVNEDETIDVLRRKDGVFISFTLLHPDEEPYISIAELVQQNWQQLGIEVFLEAIPYDQLINERLAQRDYQAALLTINLSQTPDPDPYPFWNQIQATSGQNYSQWSHRAASEYLEKARVAVELTERIRLYNNFQVVFNQETPSLILFYPIYNYAINKEVQGVRIGPLFDRSDRFNNITDWYLLAEINR